MQNQNASDKPNYQVALRTKAKEVYDRACETDNSDSGIEVIYQALKDVALESWKNGIEAGRRKASKPAGSTKQS